MHVNSAIPAESSPQPETQNSPRLLSPLDLPSRGFLSVALTSALRSLFPLYRKPRVRVIHTQGTSAFRPFYIPFIYATPNSSLLFHPRSRCSQHIAICLACAVVAEKFSLAPATRNALSLFCQRRQNMGIWRLCSGGWVHWLLAKQYDAAFFHTAMVF